MPRLLTPSGELELTRFPVNPRETLRAWDAADEYLLSYLDDTALNLDGSMLILNDKWGTLTTALAEHGPRMMSDSFLSHSAALANLARNDIAEDTVHLLSSLDSLPDKIDVLLVRAPKSLALLEDQLHRLAPHLHEGTLIVGAGMVKEIHTSTLELFERIAGPTKTSLAIKKARLIFCTQDPGMAPGTSPWPKSYQLPAGLGAASGLPVTNHAGIFSAERLDFGTMLLMQHLPRRHGSEQVVDLGCGNGAVGLSAALGNPHAEVTFIDESYLAVASAQATFRMNVDEHRAARFLVGYGLFNTIAEAQITRGSVDLILNNPPFHLHQSVSDHAAWRMFADSRTALRRGGELWVVGNRHLGYHTKLKRLFGNCEVAASNAKFVILRSVRA